MKKNLIYIFLFLSCSCFAQRTVEPSTDSISAPSLVSNNKYDNLFREHFSFSSASGLSNISKASSLSFAFPNPCMSGMFCKIEYKLEAKSGLAPRFRLGSLNYTNWMEGKGSLINRY